mmetsp:Transcript_30408/g.51837  ORF Transcript_30408/g.51837 Transcript_30408/m.51837 type:complete len:83 (+) Transcript_30408:81-329(+)
MVRPASYGILRNSYQCIVVDEKLETCFNTYDYMVVPDDELSFRVVTSLALSKGLGSKQGNRYHHSNSMYGEVPPKNKVQFFS